MLDCTVVVAEPLASFIKEVLLFNFVHVLPDVTSSQEKSC
jgi:hypothetical protein